jgi:hypothetical protein
MVYYDHDVEAVACYRKVLDDNPPHPWDNLPWSVGGENDIASMVHDHQVKRPNGNQYSRRLNGSQVSKRCVIYREWIPLSNRLLIGY